MSDFELKVFKKAYDANANSDLEIKKRMKI